MKKLTGGFAAIGLMVGVSGPVNAAYIDYTWIDIHNPADVKVTTSESHKYTHDLTDNAVPFHADGLFSGDYIESAEFWVHLYDDDDSGREEAFVNVPGFNLPFFGGPDKTFFDLSGTEFGGWSLLGWAELNLFGTYTMSIESKRGDFWFGWSRLEAHGKREVAVPEPGTLALLAIGLIGMGVALSRRRNPKK